MPKAIVWPNDPMRWRIMHYKMVPRHMYANNKNPQGQLVLQELCSNKNHSQIFVHIVKFAQNIFDSRKKRKNKHENSTTSNVKIFI